MKKPVVAFIAVSTIALFTIFITFIHGDKASLSGTLIYHRYTDYQSWDATMWSIDLATGNQVQVNKDWRTMVSPINAHFSADGQTITFMGSSAGLDENEWDVFTAHWNGKLWEEPINLTGPNGARDEDPKFSPDGSIIIYKEDGVLVTMKINGANKTYLTQGEPESSMPYFAANGEDILFERQGDIYLLKQGKEIKMYAGDGQSSYYPIGLDQESFLYTRAQSTSHDAIMKGNYDGSPSTSYFFNSPDWDTSDSYPYQDGSRYIFYVTGDYLIPHGGYNLALGDLKTQTRWDIDKWFAGRVGGDINTEFAELGPAWTAATFNY